MQIGLNAGYYSYNSNNFYNKYGDNISGTKRAAANEEVEKTGKNNDKDNTEPCQTCANRRYQDGSDDPGVSFKTPTKLSPEVAASAVRAHEYEHVANEQANAEREGGKVVSQNVSIFTNICPECKRVYVSGGETRTTVLYGSDGKAKSQDQSDIGRLMNISA